MIAILKNAALYVWPLELIVLGYINSTTVPLPIHISVRIVCNYIGFICLIILLYESAARFLRQGVQYEPTDIYFVWMLFVDKVQSYFEIFGTLNNWPNENIFILIIFLVIISIYTFMAYSWMKNRTT